MTLSLSYSHVFTGNIWKIYEDVARWQLIIEVRDYDTRSVSFSAFDLARGKFIWEDFRPVEPWWIGIEDVYDDNIFFHHFHSLQFSNHLGITCFNVSSKKRTWERNDVAFNKLLPGEIVATTNEELPQYVLIDIVTGKNVESPGPIASKQLSALDFEQHRKNKLQMPDVFLENEGHFNMVNKFLWSSQNIKAQKLMEYLEYESYVFISYYVPAINGMANYLAVIDNKGIVLSNILLDQELKGVGTATFFIFDGKLIFVKQKRELCIYEL